MKKLLFPAFVICCALLNSCEMSGISAIGAGVRTAEACCSKLSGLKAPALETSLTSDEEREKEARINTLRLLPDYSWDTKMIIW